MRHQMIEICVHSKGIVIFLLAVLRMAHTSAMAFLLEVARTILGTHCAHIEQFPGPGSAAAAISRWRECLSGRAV